MNFVIRGRFISGLGPLPDASRRAGDYKFTASGLRGLGAGLRPRRRIFWGHPVLHGIPRPILRRRSWRRWRCPWSRRTIPRRPDTWWYVPRFSRALRKIRQIFHLHLGRLAILPLNGFVNFFTMHRNRRRGRDPEANLVASNVHDRDLNVITDHDCLIALPRKYEHLWAPSQPAPISPVTRRGLGIKVAQTRPELRDPAGAQFSS